jgi:aerotaxis receptor
MRLQAVTQREHPFPAGRTLVSTTDLKGRILHANAVFVELSGYALNELLGQPHNILRHPDVPAEAFRDMWATIQAGRPWSGVVKNRRKNGDHYWVVAHVTPLLDDGRPVAYLSVRSQPTRAQIDAAEGLFALMRQEQAAGRPRHRLQGGELIRPGLGAGLSRLGRRHPWLQGMATPLGWPCQPSHGPGRGLRWVWPSRRRPAWRGCNTQGCRPRWAWSNASRTPWRPATCRRGCNPAIAH